MRLDWQRRAVILFAAFLLILSAVLVFFAVREAEREKLLKEREIEAERQRLIETIDARAKALVGEAEGRVFEAIEKVQAEAGVAEPFPSAILLKIPFSDIALVSEVFVVDDKEQIIFFVDRPLYLLPGEKRRPREIGRTLENNERWKQAEAAEFRLNDHSRAAALYGALATGTADPALDALFLNRQARCYAKSGQHEKALVSYTRQLEIGLPDLASEGIPLEVTALFQIGNILLQSGQRAEAAEAFLDLDQGLVETRWPLTRDQFFSFKKLAEGRIQTAVGELEAPLRAEWDGRLEDIKKREAKQLAWTGILEKVGQRIIPRMRLEAHDPNADSRSFLRIAEPADSGSLLVSFFSLDKNAVFGLIIDPQALADGLFPPSSGQPGPEGGWSIAVVDESGKPVASRGLVSPGTSEKSTEPQLVFRGAFTDSFPPWKINIYRSGAGAAEKEFRMRRAVYVLSLAAVIAALFFGGYLAIRSTARELKLAKLKSDFTATVSHEFRTPLTSIRYMAELLQRGRVRDEGRKQEYYETITGESERLSRLVENLLDFSKIEAGMKEYRFEETDIAALVADVAGRFRQQAALKNFSLETEIKDGIPVIPADKDSLARAVLNLLDNAVKYSGGNPRVILRIWSGDEVISIQVEDHGIGISKSEQKKIFEKFYRSESALESDVKGSGIGLPLVEHVVRAHGGKVLLESEPDKGTRVTIRLPVRRPEEKKEGKNG
jgi:signal transduction histidine kinase/tetratricopeptide (TPR) repeat protein